jgi:ligand-binding SRPBCC domain-containing protein
MDAAKASRYLWPMRVTVKSILKCPVEKVWSEVQKPSVLQRITWPLAKITSAGPAPFPSAWKVGEKYQCKIALFALLPTGTRELVFEKIDHDRHFIQTRERDPIVKRWDHTMSFAEGEGGTVYVDQIDLDASLLTPAVWLYAQLFYRYRHLRWHALARRL